MEDTKQLPIVPMDSAVTARPLTVPQDNPEALNLQTMTL